MSQGIDQPRTLSTAIPAIPDPKASASPPTAGEEEARARVIALEREARALGHNAAAAVLFHEIGLLWESPLKHPRNAAMAYQAAFKLAPRFLANIRAARRLFAEVGNWVMVVQLLDAELNGAEGKRARAALLLEKAQVQEQRLSKETEAIATTAECLALEPEDVTILVQLEQGFIEKADYPSVVHVYRLMAKAVTEETARAHYLTSAGLLLEDRLKDLPGAAAAFREAFAIDRRDPTLLEAIKRVARREGTVDEELAALAAEAENQGPLAAPTFLQISKAYERLDRTEDALAALLAARRIAPREPLIFSELARLYEAEGRFEELAEVLAAWVQSNTDENEFISINLRLAALYEEQLKRDDDAAARYRFMLERVKGNPAALAGLGKLYYRAQNWDGLLETYDAEAAAAEDDRSKAIRLYKAAETLEERLDRVDDAISRYNQCLLLSPGFLPAQKALTRLFEKLGRWADLVAMHEQDLLQTEDREQQLTALNKIATLYEDRLNDVPRAIECLKRVMELSPDHLPTMGNLARLYERGSNWTELLELNEQEARLASDTKQVVSLAHRNAEILEDHLKDRAAAIAAWERVLQLLPTYLPGLRALGRLYGQDGRWDALVKMYRTEAEIAPSTDQAAALIQKIGELYEHRLKNENEAITAYREVLTLAPNHFPALRALARIYRAQAAWENLIEILRAEAASRTDPVERANAMFQAAAIWEDQLEKPASAIEGYQEVLRLAPNHTTALQALERLLTARDDVKELVVLLDRQTQTGAQHARVAAWLKLARLYLDRLNEPQRAAACCESALGLEPRNLAGLRMLERIRSSDKPKRAELRSRIAEAVGDAKLGAAMRLSSAEGLGADAEHVLARLKEAFADDRTDEALALMLERALKQVGDAAGLLELYVHQRSATADSADLLQYSLRIAELQETKLGDPAAAIESYRTALQSAPDLYPALRGIVRCARARGDLVLARGTLDRISETAHDQQTLTAALLEAARLARDTQGDTEGAIALYRKVLEREPLHPEASPALEDLLASSGGAADLAALHEKRGEAKQAQKDLSQAAREFYEAALLYLDQLKDRDLAMAALDKALMALPTHPEALELKGTLALEAQNYAEAAAAFAVRVQQGGDAQHLASVHLKLGALYGDHLSDSTRASAHLQTALNGDPDNLEALERLAAIHSHSRNWTGAADCLKRLLELEQSVPARARHTLSLARIYDEGFNDVPGALALYKRAVDLNPQDASAMDRLAQLYERTGSIAELVTALEQQVQHASDVKRAVALKMRIAELCAVKLDDGARATSTWRQVLELDPAHLPAWIALAELYGRDPASSAMAIETHRSILRLQPTRAESLHALFRLWDGLRHFDKAFCAAAVLVFLRQASDVEMSFYSEGKTRLPNELKGSLGPQDVLLLHHLNARNPLVEVFRAVGDQFTKLYPAQFDALGVDKKADRLKADHAVFRAILHVTQLFAVEHFELYQARRGLIFLETTDPLSVCVGPDVVRRFNIREQRYLYGRAALGLFNKTALLRKLSPPELADVLGNTVRIHQSGYEGLGQRSDDQSKQLRKAYSRKSLKLLEDPAAAVAGMGPINVEALVSALDASGERAGLVMCADLVAGLNVLLKEDAPGQNVRVDTPEAVQGALAARADVQELLTFAVSDDFFRLRQRVGVALA